MYMYCMGSSVVQCVDIIMLARFRIRTCNEAYSTSYTHIIRICIHTYIHLPLPLGPYDFIGTENVCTLLHIYHFLDRLVVSDL